MSFAEVSKYTPHFVLMCSSNRCLPYCPSPLKTHSTFCIMSRLKKKLQQSKYYWRLIQIVWLRNAQTKWKIKDVLMLA